jgi:hypothetical protein
MREAIRHVTAYPGVTGKTSFAASPDAQKEIRLLTIKNGEIKELATSGIAKPGDKEKGAANEPQAGGTH